MDFLTGGAMHELCSRCFQFCLSTMLALLDFHVVPFCWQFTAFVGMIWRHFGRGNLHIWRISDYECSVSMVETAANKNVLRTRTTTQILVLEDEQMTCWVYLRTHPHRPYQVPLSQERFVEACDLMDSICKYGQHPFTRTILNECFIWTSCGFAARPLDWADAHRKNDEFSLLSVCRWEWTEYVIVTPMCNN